MGLETSTVEAVLFRSGRPLLLAPSSKPESVGKSVAIAWDGGQVASRAVAMAMPLLQHADRVVILSGDRPDLGRASDPGRLVESLAIRIDQHTASLTPAGTEGRTGSPVASSSTRQLRREALQLKRA